MEAHTKPHDLHQRLEHDRYELLRVLGSGSSGVVYEALDHHTGARVALKRLRLESPDDFLQLKNEFRSVSGITHPSLVQLGRLVCDHIDCFFTMRHVDGVTFDVALARWRGGTRSQAWFTRLALDIAEGIAVLHAHGILHRDIKPSNILIDPEGRGRLVDYGLASRAASRLSMQSRKLARAGTLAYMAPEQLSGGEVSFPADWFSFGVLLYEALHGRLPFESSFRPIAPLHEVKVDPEIAPGALGELCRALLAAQPSDRPSADEVIERLRHLSDGDGTGHHEVVQTGWSAPFVGRRDALAQLEAAVSPTRGQTSVTLVHGRAGVGKTRLCQTFLAHRERIGALVLRSRCAPNEKVPFNALDAVVDDLSRTLVHADAELRRFALEGLHERLIELFPVLARVAVFDGVEVSRRPHVANISRVVEAADALGELLGRLAQARSVLLFLDDLQFCDDESLAVLQRWTRMGKASNVCVLGCLRTAESYETSALFGALGEACVRLPLGPLSDRDVDELFATLPPVWPVDEEKKRRIRSEAQGDPLLLTSLLRLAGTGAGLEGLGVGRVVDAAVERLSKEAALLLSWLGESGGPLPEVIGKELLPQDYERARDELELEHLAQRVSDLRGVALVMQHPADGWAPHEVDPGRSAELAVAYRRVFDLSRPFDLVRHLERAQALGEASSVALAAAYEAVRLDRYDHAARLFESSFRLSPDGASAPDLESYASALLRCGRGPDAAKIFETAAQQRSRHTPSDPEVKRLLRSASDIYLRSGAYDDGRPILRQLLAQAGVSWPETTAAALRTIIWRRLRARLSPRPRPERVGATELEPALRSRLDVLWTACGSVSLYDALRCFVFQTHHAALARAALDPGHLALATATEALFLFFEHGLEKDAEVRRLLAMAEQWAARAPTPKVNAYLYFMRVSISYARGSFRYALDEARRGLQFCREHYPEGDWERANLLWLECVSLAQLGDYLELERRSAALREEARDTNNNYLATLIGLDLATTIYMVRDQVELGRQVSQDSLRRAVSSAYLEGSYAVGAVPLALYASGPAEAHALLEHHITKLRKAGLFGLRNVKLEFTFLRGTVDLARIVQGGAPRSAYVSVRRAARLLTSAPERPARHWGELLSAQLRFLGVTTGGPSAAQLVGLAVRGLQELEAGMFLGAALVLAAKIAGAELEETLSTLRNQGWVDPVRVAAVWAPAVAATR